MNTSDSIILQDGKVLKLYGGQKHRNKNSIRYFCDHVDFFLEHQDIILGDSRLFLAHVLQDEDCIFTLGGLLEWWKYMPQMAIINDEGILRYIVAASPTYSKNLSRSFLTVTTSGKVKEFPLLGEYADRLRCLEEYCSRYSKAARDFEHLSLKNVHDTVVSLHKQREKEREIEKIWSPYRDNIELLYQHREEILARRDWAMAATPLKVYMIQRPIYIGSMLRLWEIGNKWLTYPCKCGHKAFIYSFAGSPLSGTTSISYKCVHCHKQGNAQVGGFLSRAHTLDIAQQELSKEVEDVGTISLTKLLDKIGTTNLK